MCMKRCRVPMLVDYAANWTNVNTSKYLKMRNQPENKKQKDLYEKCSRRNMQTITQQSFTYTLHIYIQFSKYLHISFIQKFP